MMRVDEATSEDVSIVRDTVGLKTVIDLRTK